MFLTLFFLAACDPTPDSPAHDTAVFPDVSEPLGEGQVRAGVIQDEAALFAGISAEGKLGDLKIYNHLVQFILQSERKDGSYMTWQGGGILDADIVRPAGQPGRDFVDEWQPMAGTGHIMAPVSVTVVDDGAVSGLAHIRVEGPESPAQYITGAMENDALVPEMGLYFVTDYLLEADSPLLKVVTEVSATGPTATFMIGDIVLSSKEISVAWAPGEGMADPAPDDIGWTALQSKWNDLAVGVFAAPGATISPHPAMDLFSSLLETLSAVDDGVTLSRDESVTFTRYYGVGRDLAQLTDAWLALGDEALDVAAGVVEAPDGPVAGARVSVLVDGSFFTMALSDEQGAFQAAVPAYAQVEYVVDGRGPGYHLDLPPGAAYYSPYAGQEQRDAVLASFEGGADPIAMAQGRGWVRGSESPLVLQEPGTVTLQADDGLPFEARLSYNTSYDGGDRQLVQGSPSGYAAMAWARDGAISFPLEPGSYNVLAWRGARYEVYQATIEVLPGQAAALTFGLEEAYHLDEWLVGDPHMHAAPSPDGGITMSHRLVVAAADGIQLHFGTDHDHIVDYNPLIGPLGLSDVLATVVADEMSPLLRGHLNLYPLQSHPDEANGGAWLWWMNRVQTTAEEFAALRAAHPDALIQVNHPMSGLAEFAGWSPGVISRPDYWSPDFDCLEVNNGGGHGEAVDFYLDLAARGQLTAPVGVSDSHGYTGTGLNVTFIRCGTDDPTACSMDELTSAMQNHQTVASAGPFIELSEIPGSTLVGPTSLEARVLAPSWMPVETLSLLENGVVLETVSLDESKSATFQLDPASDAMFVVVAAGTSAMSPVSSAAPWAMTAALLLDVEGDGWQAPLSPLVLEN